MPCLLTFGLFTQTVNVLVVLGGLYLILWKPLSKTIKSRGEKIEGISGSGFCQRKGRRAFGLLPATTKRGTSGAQAILQRAAEMAEVTRSELVAQAKEEAARALEQARLK